MSLNVYVRRANSLLKLSFACSAAIALLPALALAQPAPTSAPAETPAIAAGTVAGAAAPERTPLMSLLNEAGLAQPMEDAGFRVFGYVQGGYTHSWDKQPDKLNFGRVVDFQSEEIMLNQLHLTLARTIASDKWDLGGRLEAIYGQDGGLLHSNGILDGFSRMRSVGDAKNAPENQPDIVQAYLDVNIPVGNGLALRVGKSYTLIGYESFIAPLRPFYSMTYLAGFATPFTQTGVVASYTFSPEVGASLGVTRGWEQSLEDNNDMVDFTGQLRLTSGDVTANFAFFTGPELTDDEEHWRTLLDSVVSWNATKKLTLALNSTYAYESSSSTTGGDSQWYGAAAYAIYSVSDPLKVSARVEAFRDNDGTRLGSRTTYYAATLGLGVRPFAYDKLGTNLIIRPEVRYDLATETVFDNDKHLFSVGVDAIFSF